jgi:hypothetical protein
MEAAYQDAQGMFCFPVNQASYPHIHRSQSLWSFFFSIDHSECPKEIVETDRGASEQTIELTRMQVGNDLDTPADIIVSTILEAENIIPLMKEYQSRGRKVNVITPPVYISS